MDNIPSWVLFYRNDMPPRGTSTYNRIERHNRELKTKLKASDHLVESIKLYLSLRSVSKINIKQLTQHPHLRLAEFILTNVN